MELIIKTQAGLEEILAKELTDLGAAKVEILKRAVATEGDLEFLYKAHLRLRTAQRILVPIKKFRAKTPEVLYHKIKKIWWADHMKLEDTFAVHCTAHSDYFPHSKFASLKVKDAIVDWWRMKHDDRPNVDVKRPTYTFNLHIQDDNCTLLLDASGRSLHMRGYRVKQGIAPINEILAAGIILLSGWDPTTPFIDPMCGSGTFLTEAALIALNRSPQIDHDFGFRRWKDFDKRAWENALAFNRREEKDIKPIIIGRDKDQAMVNASKVNLDTAGCLQYVTLKKEDFFGSQATTSNGTLVMNPPYDVRLEEDEIQEMYTEIGDTLKKGYSGHNAYIITGNVAAAKKIGLKTSMKKPLWNGPIECRLLKFELYDGSRKIKNDSE